MTQQHRDVRAIAERHCYLVGLVALAFMPDEYLLTVLESIWPDNRDYVNMAYMALKTEWLLARLALRNRKHDEEIQIPPITLR